MGHPWPWPWSARAIDRSARAGGGVEVFQPQSEQLAAPGARGEGECHDRPQCAALEVTQHAADLILVEDRNLGALIDARRLYRRGDVALEIPHVAAWPSARCRRR